MWCWYVGGYAGGSGDVVMYGSVEVPMGTYGYVDMSVVGEVVVAIVVSVYVYSMVYANDIVIIYDDAFAVIVVRVVVVVDCYVDDYVYVCMYVGGDMDDDDTVHVYA